MASSSSSEEEILELVYHARNFLESGNTEQAISLFATAVSNYNDLQVEELRKLAFQDDVAQYLFEAKRYDDSWPLDDDTLARLQAIKDFDDIEDVNEWVVATRHRLACGLSEDDKVEQAIRLHNTNLDIWKENDSLAARETYDSLTRDYLKLGLDDEVAVIQSKWSSVRTKAMSTFLRAEEKLMKDAIQRFHLGQLSSAHDYFSDVYKSLENSQYKSTEPFVAATKQCEYWLEKCRQALYPQSSPTNSNKLGEVKREIKSDLSECRDDNAKKQIKPSKSQRNSIKSDTATEGPQRLLRTQKGVVSQKEAEAGGASSGNEDAKLVQHVGDHLLEHAKQCSLQEGERLDIRSIKKSKEDKAIKPPSRTHENCAKPAYLKYGRDSPEDYDLQVNAHVKRDPYLRMSRSCDNVSTTFRHSRGAELASDEPASDVSHILDSADYSRLMDIEARLDTPAGKADRWFRKLQDQTHAFVYGRDDMYRDCDVGGETWNRVKVAVLDTGIAMPPHQRPSLLVKENINRIQDCKRFKFSGTEKEGTDGHEKHKIITVSEEGIQDIDGHGTFVAMLVLQVCPNADLYVARVLERHNEQIDPFVVAKAIEYAVQKWGVDIITMSLGWTYEYECVKKKLLLAQNANILVFAATSNEGTGDRSGIAFPARASNVISVDAADGDGEPSSFNPPSNDKNNKKGDRLTAPGEGVESAWPLGVDVNGSGYKRDDGTSFATPIVAGTAALVLEFSRQPPLGHDQNIGKKLKEMDIMRAILHEFCSEKSDTPRIFRFLYPWLTFTGGNHVSGRFGGDAYDIGSPRFGVASDIIRHLRKNVDPAIGTAVFDKVKIVSAQRKMKEIEDAKASKVTPRVERP